MINYYALAAVIAYLVLQVGIALFANRFIKTENDYLLAGRQLGFVLLTFSLFASWFGAETVVASSGAIAAEGLSGGRAEPFGYALCLVVMAVFLAVKLRAQGFVTVSDFYRQRFGVWSEKLSVILMIPTSLIWAAAQALAFGHVLSSVAGTDLTTGLMIATGLCLLYTMIGGFRGDVYSDFVQGIIVMIGLVVTAVFVVLHLGGLDAALSTITAERLMPINFGDSIGLQFDEWTIAVVGSLAAQEAIQRLLAARDPKAARSSCLGAAGLYLIVGLIPAFIGLAGAHLVDAAALGDEFLPTLAKNVLPPVVYFLFLGALCSAILTTIDTTLLSISALVGHNVILRLKPDLSERQKVLTLRLIVALSGLLVFGIAAGGETIYNLIEMSSSFGSSGLVVCLFFGLWTRFGGIVTSLVTLVSGAVSAWAFQYHFELEMGYTASLLVCIIVYITMSYIERVVFRTQKEMLHAS